MAVNSLQVHNYANFKCSYYAQLQIHHFILGYVWMLVQKIFFFTSVVCCNSSSYPVPEMLSFSFCLLKTASLKAQIALIGQVAWLI